MNFLAQRRQQDESGSYRQGLQRDERRRTDFHLSVFEIVPFLRVGCC